jgi:hypothetical protein
MLFFRNVILTVLVLASIAPVYSKTKMPKLSTVTSYQSDSGVQQRKVLQPERDDNGNFRWTCPADNSGAISVCHLNCSARPPEPVGSCSEM